MAEDRRLKLVIEAQNRAKSALREAGTDVQALARQAQAAGRQIQQSLSVGGRGFIQSITGGQILAQARTAGAGIGTGLAAGMAAGLSRGNALSRLGLDDLFEKTTRRAKEAGKSVAETIGNTVMPRTSGAVKSALNARAFSQDFRKQMDGLHQSFRNLLQRSHIRAGAVDVEMNMDPRTLTKFGSSWFDAVKNASAAQKSGSAGGIFKAILGDVGSFASSFGKAGLAVGMAFVAGFKVIGQIVHIAGEVLARIAHYAMQAAKYISIAGAAMIGLGAYSESAASDLERQRAQLEALTKSSKEAGNIISWVRGEAKKTPFEVPGLVEMTAQLKSVGLDYQYWFSKLGDLAVQGGRDLSEGLDMATSAVVRLKTGSTGEAFEQLRRLKISRADFMAQGIQFNKGGQLESSTSDALDALAKIIDAKFGGSMKKMESTAGVMKSNVKDIIRDIALSIAGIGQGGEVKQGGFFDKWKGALSALLQWVEKNRPKIEAFGKSIGDVFVKAIDWVAKNGQTIIGWGVTAYQIFQSVAAGVKNFLDGLLGVDASSKTITDTITSLLSALQSIGNWWQQNGKAIGNALGWIIDITTRIGAVVVMVLDVAGAAVAAIAKTAVGIGYFLSGNVKAAKSNLDDMTNIVDTAIGHVKGYWGFITREHWSLDVKPNVDTSGFVIPTTVTPTTETGGTPYVAPDMLESTKTASEAFKDMLKNLQAVRGAWQSWSSAQEAMDIPLSERLATATQIAQVERESLDYIVSAAREAGLGYEDMADYANEYYGQLSNIANAEKAVKDIRKAMNDEILSGAEAGLEVGKSYLEMIKAQGLGQGAVRSATMQVLQLEKERLAVLESQVAQAEQMGKWIDADTLRAKVLDVKKEIFDMQKSLRGNLEDEFNQIASKIVNAPANLTQVLARSGAALWKDSVAAFNRTISYSPAYNTSYASAPVGSLTQPQYTVYVQIGDQQIEGKIVKVVDSRIRQHQ